MHSSATIPASSTHATLPRSSSLARKADASRGAGRGPSSLSTTSSHRLNQDLTSTFSEPPQQTVMSGRDAGAQTAALRQEHRQPQQQQHRGLVPQASFVRPETSSSPSLPLPSTSAPVTRSISASSTIAFETATGHSARATPSKPSNAPSSATPIRSMSSQSRAGISSTTPQQQASATSRKQEAILPHADVDPAPPTTMYWSKTPVQGRIPRGLRAHSATLVGNNVWCFGGCDAKGTCFRDVWKFDCDTYTWTKPKVTGQVPPVTRAHTATTALDDYIFVFGGGDGPTYYNDVYILDTVCLSWSKPVVRGRAPSKRRAHTAFVYEDKILVFGGGNGTNALNDMHALDVSDLEDLAWTGLETYGQVPVARGYHTSNLVGDGSKCVMYGGSDGSECFGDVHILDLDTLTWSGVDLVVDQQSFENQAGFPRLSHSTTTVGSNLLVFGGHDGVTFSNQVLMFNLVTLQWEHLRTAGIAPSPRGYHATVMHDSRILIFGGFNGQQVFDEVWTLELAGSAYLPQVTNFTVGGDAEAE
ncbi:hypothetical protein OIV83_005213 [Microbotryomycetes sp. JL201]|nr:hypothetical protein OIV83_005213 [Microbotryomycetes sp. JL201]